MKCPCKGCTDRTITCHSVCSKYEEWKIYDRAVKDDLKEKGAMYISDHSLREYWNNLRRVNRKFVKK